MPTVIMPAHNEAETIGVGLDALLAGAPPVGFRVIVAANGCTDQTAEVARAHLGSHPGQAHVVLDLPTPSKVGALNRALEMVDDGSVVVVDADVTVDAATIGRLVEALDEPGILAASTGLQLDLEHSSLAVRSYSRYWVELPSIRNGLSGRGVYALGQPGLDRIGRFPDIIGDDALVDRLFGARERRIVDAASLVEASPTLRSLIARKTRVFAGNQELEGFPASGDPVSSSWTQVVRANPIRVIDLPAYLAINAVAKIAARRARRSGSLRWGHRSEAGTP